MPALISPIQVDPSAIDDLRNALSDAERALVALRSDPKQAAQLIRLYDTIVSQLEAFKSQDYDLRPEESRLESIDARMQREARYIARRVRASGEVDSLANSSGWRELREIADAQTKAQIKRMVITGGVLGAIFILVFVVLPWLFPAPPRANTTTVSQYAMEQKFDEALAFAEDQAQQVPEDPDIWIWLGALYERLGRTQDAEAAWVKANELINEVDFHNTRGIVRIQTGDYVAAESDARFLIEQSEFAANGYYLLGQALSAQNKYQEAIEAFEEAARIAEETDNATIVVASKLELQTLLQRGPAMGLTPTPAP
jgi:Cytochrome c biogenesis factor